MGKKKLNIHGSSIFLGLMIILMSNFLASFLSGNGPAITRTAANILLLIGARGCGEFYSYKIGIRSVSWFFLASFVYWLIYIITLTMTGGVLADYDDLFQNGEAINHHILGMIVSVSSIFIGIRFFWVNEKMKIAGYFIILIGAIICFITQSRSNTFFTLLGVLMIFIFEGRSSIFLAIRLGLISVFAYFVFALMLEQSDSLSQRFDISDTDYQERTTEVRFEMLKSGLIEFLTNPLGKGAGDTEVVIDQRTQMVHNQYLTYAIGGGFLGFIGIVVWLRGVYNSLVRLYSRKPYGLQNLKFEIAILISVAIFQITLFTLEYSNMFFFQVIALSIFVEIRLKKICNNYV